jgi:hypothetical protein
MIDITDKITAANVEISLIYNSTCPPGFKEILVNESFPVCLQCNDTSPANDTTTKSYTMIIVPTPMIDITDKITAANAIL